MANAFTKAQFMEAPTGVTGPVLLGAVKAGAGINITADGTISATQGGGTITDIVATNGIQGGGQGPQVFLGLLPPTATTIGGVRTIPGSNISIDNAGVIRSTNETQITAGVGITVQSPGAGFFTISAKAAGNSVFSLGGVYVPPSSGLSLSTQGELKLAPPTESVIGGVRAGAGVTITSEGVLNATGTGGTITGVGAGTGLGGGGVTGAVSLFLRPATSNTIGGVYPGENVTIDPDGRINVSDAALGVLSVGASFPLVAGGSITNPVLGILTASTSQPGAVRLSNAIDSTVDEGFAATPLAVKTVADVANAALPRSGGIMTNNIQFASTQGFPGTISNDVFIVKGGMLAGLAGGTYGLLSPGTNGQVLTADSTTAFGLTWTNVGTGTVTNVTGTAPVQVATGTTTPVISVNAATTTSVGVVQLYDGTDSTSSTLASTANSVKTAFDLAAAALPLAGGTMTGSIVFNAGQTFPGTLPLAGGTMTGDITFAATQTFPGVLTQGAISATDPINVGGTLENPIISVDIATTTDLGVVRPDGTSITINGSGVISAVGATGSIQRSIFTAAGSLITSTAASTPSQLTVGAAGTILAVNAGAPAWRTSAQLGLLTSAAAATTYAPIDVPTFTGTVTVNSGGSAGSNALVVSGGSLVLSTPFTPASSGAAGSTGEITWDADYLYVCTAPNTWGRVAIDLTPF